MSAPDDEKDYWFDRPRTHDLIFHTLVVVCVLLIPISIYTHGYGHDFPIEERLGALFYAGFGFIAYCGIIAGAIQLRKLVQREEDYYGE
jgi:hypothetical protein